MKDNIYIEQVGVVGHYSQVAWTSHTRACK